ncbi:ABC transporter substrate-binding protein [Paenibacillus allorhizosphaerae]|uniref:Extracellular solute-binding protein n=1 Tax=Paenibacillus allorhizosphaerae TaxID=2849866 RepID=A0ABN7TKB1_9BACL|nr:extracellular solute-binding protein [Paenibacillus allorhizosphaerae]CAG7643247.1 hypothetical protein PAECIP111802_02978 [Paenibacillus allorhizosphaerae]
MNKRFKSFTSSSPQCKVSTYLCIPAVFITALLSGCGNGNAPDDASKTKTTEQQEPVTVKVGVKASGYLTDEEFKRFIAEPVKKKYPWITAEKTAYDDKLLPEQVTAKQVPDIIITNNVNGIPIISEMKLLEPMTEGIKKHNIDLSRFEPQALEAIKAATRSNDLVALPYTQNFSALYYNKDIFDKFAVPYPKDGMTWQEAAELARKVTKVDGGVQYRGLEPNVPERMGSQLSVPLVDATTNRALVNTEQWKKVMQQAADIYTIPGNGKHAWKTAGINLFVKDRTLAMHADVNIIATGRFGDLPDFNWDMASYPVFPDAPGIGMGPDMHILVPTSTSQHKDDVYRVITTVISDEVQLDMAGQGKTSVMKDGKFKTAFGKDLAFLKGKNIAAPFKTSAAKPYTPTLHDTIAMSAIQAELREMFTKGKDVNSALRAAEEKINKDIEAKLK